mmetsp:Transcript_69/g.60  ORF Transcript_69/g.60 Transcript_69/m.60 type:complete len:255 (-) Transcript_69:195-959(-)|eukprot:CAMPEP_0204839890 /NCGR_PEP_ID=MMETSP1346-20131115/35792_1 /ASSEMBLY_ACC=CAM_ASM_000771 /TAXON_ID=215587 /ORGANISM="Aplanochytrium stocchinoi, Strain GSBS06" /LENGTH=254 /DNA_ID=CAMNT_0051976957 /DNA_START=159 /DNA_END=923 /DNA_ORIENTATION=+
MSLSNGRLQNSNASVEELRDQIEKEALEVIEKKLPLTVMQIHKLVTSVPVLNHIKPIKLEANLPSIDSILEYKKNLDDENDPSKPNAKRKRPNSNVDTDDSNSGAPPVVKANKEIEDMMNLLKKELMGGIEMLGQVKTWIQFNIPRIEDGNNFGVGVQEECVAEIGRVEDVSFAALESMSKYYQIRARLVHKMTKHPYVLDYRQAVLEIDETQFAKLRYSIVDMRNNFAFIHDLLIKNFEKLKKPRSEVNTTMF